MNLLPKNLSFKHELRDYLTTVVVSATTHSRFKKCETDSCTLCEPIRLPRAVFDTLHFLPNPMPGDEGQYKPFMDLLGRATDETHQPSLQKAPKQTKTLIFCKCPTCQKH